MKPLEHKTTVVDFRREKKLTSFKWPVPEQINILTMFTLYKLSLSLKETSRLNACHRQTETFRGPAELATLRSKFHHNKSETGQLCISYNRRETPSVF